MSYPLPGETIARTVEGVEFGHGYAADEPAPAEVARAVRRLLLRERTRDAALLAFEADRTHLAWAKWDLAATMAKHCYRDILRLMGRHLYRSYLCDGYRVRLVIEPEGCRRHSVSIEEVPE